MFLLIASASSGAARDTGPITTAHLILIAVLIVLVIAAIIWGARQKRVRVQTDSLEAQRTDQLLAHPQTETAVSPAPPPLGDSGMTATAAKAVARPAAQPKPAARPKPAAKPKAAAPAKAAVVKPAAKAAAKPAPAAAKPATAKPAAKAPAAKAAATKPRAAAKSATARLAAPKAAPKTAPKAAPKSTAVKPVVAKPAAAKPAAKPATKPAAAAHGLIDVKGLGPKAVPLLEAQGVRDLAALAALSPARATEIDAGLGALSGRMARDKWIDQAKLLSAGKVAEFEKTYGKL